MNAPLISGSSWLASNIVQRLIIVNVVVFLFIHIANAILGLFMTSINQYVSLTEWFAVPANLTSLLIRPWTLFTYMFLHEDFFHILFNMLWLYWMGNLFLEYLGAKKVFSTYVLGGIAGALLYVLSYNLFPLFQPVVTHSFALGASAGVLAITVGIATLLPDYQIRLLLLGSVPLKYIAGVTILIDMVSISSSNAGGHLAHLGGAIFGFIYIKQLKNGNDLAGWFNRIIDKIISWFNYSGKDTPTRKKTRSKSDEDFLQQRKASQDQIDEILDKISKSGYGSLSQKEKDILFKSSKES